LPLRGFPLPEKKFSKLHFFGKNVKPCLVSRLPLGGKLLAKQGGEGQPNNNQAFSRQKAALYSTRVPGFPVGEAVGFCRLKRSLHAFPLPEKKFGELHFFSTKIVSRFAASPWGEAPCKAR